MTDNNNILSLAATPGSGWRTTRVIAGTAATIAVLYGPQTALLSVIPTRATWVPRAIHSVFCNLLGVRVETSGQCHDEGPVLYVANHMSWLDIPLIGANVNGSFVARADMQQWGIFKYLCGLQRTIFVDRERRHRTMDQRDELIDRLAAGNNIILFPEGTTSNGNRLLPFKTSLFGVVEAARKQDIDLKVQPLTLAYTGINNLPMGRFARQNIAWIGDEDLNPHFNKVMNMGRIDARLHYHEPVSLDDFNSRKDLAKHCETVIGKSLRRANSGRFDSSS